MPHRHVLIEMADGTRLAARLFLPDELPAGAILDAATVPAHDLSDVFEAVLDATEEAVLNALWAAPEVVGREGRVGPALPHDDVLELLAAHGRLDT